MHKDIKWANKELPGLTHEDLENIKVSDIIRSENGRQTINQNRTIESCSKGGKIGGPIGGAKSRDEKTGFHAMSKEDRIEVSKKVGNIIGPRSFQEGFGMYGLSDEEKLAVAKYAAQQSIKSPNHVNNRRLTCPHCKKEGGYTAMKRHHMDRCKHKK
jgi:hypothetical protein